MKMICNFFKALELFVFPKVCLLCENGLFSNEWDCCSSCLDKFPIISEEQQKSLLMQNVDFYLIKGLYSYLWFTKKGIIQEVLHQYKYKNQLTIGKQLSRAFVLRNKLEWENQFDCVVPVPMHSIKKWFRGYNQATIIAEVIANELNVPLFSNGLIKKHTFKVQAKLSKRQRELITNNRFKIMDTEYFKGKKILLVDDVYTTGTTIYNCAELLKKVGAKSVVAATLVSVK